ILLPFTTCCCTVMTLPNSDLKIPKTTKESSFKIVRNTIESLRNLIETQPWHDLKVLLGGNADFEENSTNRLFASGDTTYELVVKSDLLDGVLSALDEFLVDINACSENVSDLSLDLIHSDELILTRGFSQAVYQFLRRAAEKKRMFKVIVCEGYPDNLGHKFAEDLSKEGINVILVPDSHAFGLMSRVNKVIIGCNVVYPDGTMKAPIGTHSVLLAAKHFTIPVSGISEAISCGCTFLGGRMFLYFVNSRNLRNTNVLNVSAWG
ncbi:translation initiation factor eIF-2B subunit beta, partial [Paragonimus westermani]